MDSYGNASVATVLRRIAEALSAMSAEDLKRLEDPQYGVEIRAVRRRAKEEAGSGVSDADVDGVIAEITALSSRQDAQVLLDAKYSSRKALETIARRLDIPIAKQDKVEGLRDKIIEATVGARIRSHAIQGTSASPPR